MNKSIAVVMLVFSSFSKNVIERLDYHFTNVYIRQMDVGEIQKVSFTYHMPEDTRAHIHVLAYDGAYEHILFDKELTAIDDNKVVDYFKLPEMFARPEAIITMQAFVEENKYEQKFSFLNFPSDQMLIEEENKYIEGFLNYGIDNVGKLTLIDESVSIDTSAISTKLPVVDLDDIKIMYAHNFYVSDIQYEEAYLKIYDDDLFPYLKKDDDSIIRLPLNLKMKDNRIYVSLQKPLFLDMKTYYSYQSASLGLVAVDDLYFPLNAKIKSDVIMVDVVVENLGYMNVDLCVRLFLNFQKDIAGMCNLAMYCVEHVL